MRVSGEQREIENAEWPRGIDRPHAAAAKIKTRGPRRQGLPDRSDR
jgi:hypothetical protein